MNNVILVGRLVSDPELEEFNTEKKRTLINLAVPRNYRNSEGMYESDFIRCVLWNGIALNTSKYCQKGDVVAVRGKIQVNSYEDQNNNKKYITEVIAQSISFVAPRLKEKSQKEKINTQEKE